MAEISDGIWNEVQQIGKDYESIEEVGLYDQSHAKFRDMEIESSQILSFIGAKGEESLLDIGCGTGAFIRHAARRGLRCTGLDVSDQMLAFARQATPAEQSIDYVKGGFLSRQKVTDRFDIVTSSFSFHHLPDFYKFIGLQNLHALLNEGGVFFFKMSLSKKMTSKRTSTA